MPRHRIHRRLRHKETEVANLFYQYFDMSRTKFLLIFGENRSFPYAASANVLKSLHKSGPANSKDSSLICDNPTSCTSGTYLSILEAVLSFAEFWAAEVLVTMDSKNSSVLTEMQEEGQIKVNVCPIRESFQAVNVSIAMSAS